MKTYPVTIWTDTTSFSDSMQTATYSINEYAAVKMITQEAKKLRTKCRHCGQHGKAQTACLFCGAPID